MRLPSLPSWIIFFLAALLAVPPAGLSLAPLVSGTGLSSYDGPGQFATNDSSAVSARPQENVRVARPKSTLQPEAIPPPLAILNQSPSELVGRPSVGIEFRGFAAWSGALTLPYWPQGPPLRIG